MKAQDMGQVVGKTRHTEWRFVEYREIGNICLVPQPSLLDKRKPCLSIYRRLEPKVNKSSEEDEK